MGVGSRLNALILTLISILFISLSASALPGQGIDNSSTSVHPYDEMYEVGAFGVEQDYTAPRAPPTSLPEMTAVYAFQAPDVPNGAVMSLEKAEGSDYVYHKGLYYPWDDFLEASSGKEPFFWVETTLGWSWYASMPCGSWTRKLMYLPRGGSLKLYETYSDGKTRTYDYGWTRRGYKYLWFKGDLPGEHISIFTINDVPSNAVSIHVEP
jgi:hypothetical protein